MEEVSFTSKVKEEITTKPFSEERLRSLLSAFIRVNGKLNLSSIGESIVLQIENAKIAKFIFKILQDLYGINARLSFSKSMRFYKKTSYKLTIENYVDDLLSDLEIDFLDGKISKTLAFNEDTIGGYLDGAFLASGSVNSPKTSNYHLEIKVDNDNYAKWLTKLILKYNKGSFSAKVTTRRNSSVIYLKKSDQIADFLILLGATESCIEFENVRVDRDFSNIGNRWQNCDQANYSKTVGAAQAQIEDIKFIDRAIGINNLKTEKERKLCELRLSHEDGSMLEMSVLLSEELGRDVSKSNVAHIFRKLHELAEIYKK